MSTDILSKCGWFTQAAEDPVSGCFPQTAQHRETQAQAEHYENCRSCNARCAELQASSASFFWHSAPVANQDLQALGRHNQKGSEYLPLLSSSNATPENYICGSSRKIKIIKIKIALCTMVGCELNQTVLKCSFKQHIWVHFHILKNIHTLVPLNKQRHEYQPLKYHREHGGMFKWKLINNKGAEEAILFIEKSRKPGAVWRHQGRGELEKQLQQKHFSGQSRQRPASKPGLTVFTFLLQWQNTLSSTHHISQYCSGRLG